MLRTARFRRATCLRRQPLKPRVTIQSTASTLGRSNPTQPNGGTQPSHTRQEIEMSYSAQVEKDYEVRGWYSSVQEIRHDGGSAGDSLLRVAIGVIIKNPFAGKYVPDLGQLTKPSASLGHALGERAVSLLGGRPVESYGKGGI